MLSCLVLAAVATPSAFGGGPALDREIDQAIAEHRLPGAVLVVGHGGHVVYRKAYGNRSLEPTTEPMTVDTVFDLASLTKVIATTPALMKLFEQGKFRLNDRLTQYIPEFQGGRSRITLRNLMTHFSGLRPDIPMSPALDSYDAAIKIAAADPPIRPPETEHIYSDTNFILLAEIVRRISGQTLAEYTTQNVYRPLGMKDTMFNPPASLIPRIAPTERDPVTGIPFRGVVHDPRSRAMGGVAGHAGLFSTGDDLAKFAQMMINEGRLGGVRIFEPLTVQKFTEPQTPPNQAILRGLGWDIDSPYSSNRGELFPIGSYGHSGFTGTSIWIDPSSNSYVILLANSVHPTIRGSIVPLRAKVSTIVAAALGITSQRVSLTGYNDLMTGPGFRRPITREGKTMTGLDVLEARNFADFAGKKIGLITNHTGLDKQGRRNIDAMRAAGVQIEALFSPEHGFAGRVDHPGIANTVDPDTGVKVFSLFGETFKPTPEMLKGLDALVYDIQDVGVRFYTYETTMSYCLEAAAQAHIPYYVLDRPNPITGTRFEGPMLDAANVSFVGYKAGMPVRHGMTMGELATMYNAENKIGADLHVVKMEDWERGDWFDSTDLSWTSPSPNMRSLNAAIVYPGVCFLESLNVSVGRGTDAPFEQIGADFIDGRQLADYLNHHSIEGVRVYPTSFTPTESKFQGKHIEGVRFQITDRDNFKATDLGIELCCAIQKLYPGKVNWQAARHLIGSNEVIKMIESGEGPWTIMDTYDQAEKEFGRTREKYLLYSQR